MTPFVCLRFPAPQRVPDHRHSVTRRHMRSIVLVQCAPLCVRVAFDTQHPQVELRTYSQQGRLVPFAPFVGDFDLDLGGVVDDVCAREDVALGVDEKPGAVGVRQDVNAVRGFVTVLEATDDETDDGGVDVGWYVAVC